MTKGPMKCLDFRNINPTEPLPDPARDDKIKAWLKTHVVTKLPAAYAWFVYPGLMDTKQPPKDSARFRGRPITPTVLE